MRFLTGLQNIDRRIVYILVAVVIIIPLIWSGLNMPVLVPDEVKASYQTVENIKPGKIALISVTWGSGTQAENRTQMEVVVRHLFKKGVPILVLPWDLQGDPISYDLMKSLSKEMGKTEGVDWVSTGYRPAYIDVIVQAMGQDLLRPLGKDKRGIPLQDTPMFEKIIQANHRDGSRMTLGRDVGMIMETTPSATLPIWISFAGQQFNIPIVYGPTAVMVPEGYNYLDSKQVAGMLPGLMGAAEYDVLLKHQGFAQRGANALSMAHALIIVLIVLGNLGYFLSRRRADGV